MFSDMRHFQALTDTAAIVGWPVRFQADLTEHDRAHLATMPTSAPFAWILRSCGTGLYFPGRVDGAGHMASDMARIQANAFGRENCRFFLWDGVGLSEFPSATALDDATREIEANAA
jgi:hypothetical protein